MCGIVGIVNLEGDRIDANMLAKMTSLLAWRGPDDEGYLIGNLDNGTYITASGEDTSAVVLETNHLYCPKINLTQLQNNTFNLGFGHRRLSIIDLSAAGHQPMCDETGTVWIIYNGEIYNYIEIRAMLESKGHLFRTRTDVEVIIKAYIEWGEGCLNKFNGMWSFCIWDTRKNELFCSRDRFGVKPLYYYYDDKLFAFSSEIKSLLATGIAVRPNDGLIYDFLRSGLLDHTDETFYLGIKKLPQSHYLKLSHTGGLSLTRYWDIDISDEIKSAESDITYANKFREVFYDAVRIRLRSDVPIGSCLSGGLDSSSIVIAANQLMFPQGNKSASEKQKTFSACYDIVKYDERKYIELVIRNTNAERNYVFPSAAGFTRELDDLIYHQEEPFISSSLYAQWCVMGAARDCNVPVLLDGQGSDEQLAGYLEFYLGYIRHLFSSRRYADMAREAVMYLSSPAILSHFSDRLYQRPLYTYISGVPYNDDFLSDRLQAKYGHEPSNTPVAGSIGQQIKTNIFSNNLPALLRYEDKSSMAFSIETRLPFLDYRLVELIASLPIEQKLRNGWTKYVLRNAMRDVLPRPISLRKSKLGFATPEEPWFSRDMASNVQRVFDEPFFLGEYAKCDELSRQFKRNRSRTSPYWTNIFFRYYITELWGRKLILNMKS
jgi:asparagine synthase (glutamine-hydrolysing)